MCLTTWSYGSGKPVIALGSDVECIPKASQKPGVAYSDPIVVGAPGHGEGHNSGQALNIVAALTIKKIMEREKIQGTLMLWPGIAEELVGTKAYYVREGYFKDVDACIFTHVGHNLGVGYGDNGNNGLVSVKFNFEGQAAHARTASSAQTSNRLYQSVRRNHLLLPRCRACIMSPQPQP